jgi:hypothetical protein
MEERASEVPRDPRVEMMEQLVDSVKMVMITHGDDSELIGVAMLPSGEVVTQTSDWTMGLVEKLLLKVEESG